MTPLLHPSNMAVAKDTRVGAITKDCHTSATKIYINNSPITPLSSSGVYARINSLFDGILTTLMPKLGIQCR